MSNRKDYHPHLLFVFFVFSLLSFTLTSSKDDPSTIILRFQQYLQINTAQPNPNYQESSKFILSLAHSLSFHSQTLEFIPGHEVRGLQYLEAILKLKASGFVLVRDVYLSFILDEEIGGHDGTEKFAESEVFNEMNVVLCLMRVWLHRMRSISSLLYV
ncbi:hypothetical protein LguiA_022731 [Lonicera macranthoides]